jgi:hypothetical protein
MVVAKQAHVTTTSLTPSYSSPDSSNTTTITKIQSVTNSNNRKSASDFTCRNWDYYIYSHSHGL